MLLVIEMLIGRRADVAQRRVTPASIIERFDVEEKVSSGFVASAVHSMPRPLALQRAEEAFHGGIVVPAANPVHTGLDIVLFEQLLVGVVGVLTALIRMVNETRTWLALTEGHLQRPQGQLSGHAIRHRPADNPARAQVQDAGQIEPAFQRGNVGDICQPLLVRPLGHEVSLQHVRSDRVRSVALGGSPVLLGMN
jgi:hypothetical protein